MTNNPFARVWRELMRGFCVLHRQQWSAPWTSPSQRSC
jgi:hypothetical protein